MSPLGHFSHFENLLVRYPNQNISKLAFFNHIWTHLPWVNGNPLVLSMTCTKISQGLWKAIQTKSPFSKVRIQLFSIKEVEIALFPDFYGNCITTAAPLIYEKSLLSVWKGQCVEYVWNALSYRVLRRKKYKSKWFLYCLSATFEIHWSTL